MAKIHPFNALRPIPELADKVAALPYDVMNTKEAIALAKGNPYSFLHVSRAEIDFMGLVDEHSQIVYDKARENFKKMISDGVLIQEKTACLYVYALVMNGRQQIGLVACSSVDDYFNDVIKKHESTRPEKEQDRITHMEALQAHVGPIFLTYPQNTSVDVIISQVMTAQNPVYNFTTPDKIQHTVWVIDKKDIILKLSSLFNREVPYTYIADGHHRAASAAKVGKQIRANGKSDGSEEYNYFLSVLFPANQLAIMDYNRVVKDLNGLSTDDFFKKVGEKFNVKRRSNAYPRKLHDISMYLEGDWYQLTPIEKSFKDDVVGILDVSILQENLLNPVLGIDDPRTNKRIEFVGGIRGLEELERRVDEGEMKVAFALYPVSIQQLINISDAGQMMPPKSTWFEPKLRDGLFCHLF